VVRITVPKSPDLGQHVLEKGMGSEFNLDDKPVREVPRYEREVGSVLSPLKMKGTPKDDTLIGWVDAG